MEKGNLKPEISSDHQEYYSSNKHRKKCTHNKINNHSGSYEEAKDTRKKKYDLNSKIKSRNKEYLANYNTQSKTFGN